MSQEEITVEMIKEVYAQFGLTYCDSECLHRELCHLYVYSTIPDSKYMTKPRIEEKLSEAYSMTLGQVKDKLRDIVHDDFFYELDEAVAKRNFLAHRFWFEKIHLMYSRKGISQMIRELLEYAKMFSKLDEKVSAIATQRVEEKGLFDDEMQKKALEEVKSGKPMDKFPKVRKLKKKEKLINVWECGIPEEGMTMIFELDDGSFWQLCDVGLGWTKFEKIEKDWSRNEKIKPYLPAIINPRPKCKSPFCYEFQLKENKILWFRHGKQEKTFMWGVK